MRQATIAAQAELEGGRPPAVVATVGATMSLVVFLTGWPVYSMLILGGTKALSYYMMSVAFAAVVALMSVSERRYRPGSIVSEPLVWCLSIYLLLGLLWVQFSPGDPEFLAQIWRARVLVLLLLVSMLVLVGSAKRGWITSSIAVAFLFNVAIYWFDLAYPGTVVPLGFPGSNPGRAAGFHLNANEASSALVGTSIALLALSPMRFRGLVLVALFLGVAATLSRSGIILSVLLVLFARKRRLLDRRQLGMLLSAVPVLALAFSFFYALMLTLPEVDIENVNGRLLWFATGGREVDDSASQRIQVAKAALDMFLESPVLGQGFAASLRDPIMEPHNMYLMLAAEQGIVGLAVYAAFLYLIVSRGTRLVRESGDDIRRVEQGMALIAMGGFIAIQSLFSHNVLDQPTFYLVLSSLLAVSSRPADRRPG